VCFEFESERCFQPRHRCLSSFCGCLALVGGSAPMEGSSLSASCREDQHGIQKCDAADGSGFYLCAYSGGAFSRIGRLASAHCDDRLFARPISPCHRQHRPAHLASSNRGAPDIQCKYMASNFPLRAFARGHGITVGMDYLPPRGKEWAEKKFR
jgi:hypothetical protein